MSLEPRLDTEDGTAGELALFQNAMESRYGYRPKAFLPGALLHSRDADRFEGFQLARNLAASAAPQPRLTTLEREREELRAEALRLIEAAQPFAMFNSSEPTITVRTPDVARLRAMLHAIRLRLAGTEERSDAGTPCHADVLLEFVNERR
ncbi:MAG TPA: hypothetical protein VEY92_10550 [Pseudoxanthomonas sp.]|nr:hypothetical protein [Pseudoxanthomonas sp.]